MQWCLQVSIPVLAGEKGQCTDIFAVSVLLYFPTFVVAAMVQLSTGIGGVGGVSMLLWQYHNSPPFVVLC